MQKSDEKKITRKISKNVTTGFCFPPPPKLKMSPYLNELIAC